MSKKIAVLLGLLLVGGMSFAEEGRWFISTDKQTGKEVAVLSTWSKRPMKVLPLEQERRYSPVPYEDIADKKQMKRAMRRGNKFTRLTVKNTSATPLDGGRLLVLQEQTIVMPPQLEIQLGKPIKTAKGDLQEPEDNSLLVTLYEASGKVLWSRKFGPLAGRLPVNREAWALPGPGLSEAISTEKKRPDAK